MENSNVVPFKTATDVYPTQPVTPTPISAPPMPTPTVAHGEAQPHHVGMSEVTRHEMNASLAASEAKMAASLSEMKSEFSGIRSEFATARSEFAIIRNDVNAIRSEMATQAKMAQASADAFYAKAGGILSEINLTNEKHKNAIYGLGYRVIAWTLGTLVGVGALVVGAYRAYLTIQGG